MNRFLVIIFITAFSMNGFAKLISPGIVNPSNGHHYYLLDLTTYPEAEAEAKTLGGHLVTFSDRTEHDWVFQNFGLYENVSRNYFIGLLRGPEVFDEFLWTTSEPVSFYDWAPGEPNTWDDAEMCGMVYGGKHKYHGQWNDSWAFEKNFAVVEVEGEEP